MEEEVLRGSYHDSGEGGSGHDVWYRDEVDGLVGRTGSDLGHYSVVGSLDVRESGIPGGGIDRTHSRCRHERDAVSLVVCHEGILSRLRGKRVDVCRIAQRIDGRILGEGGSSSGDARQDSRSRDSLVPCGGSRVGDGDGGVRNGIAPIPHREDIKTLGDIRKIRYPGTVPGRA